MPSKRNQEGYFKGDDRSVIPLLSEYADGYFVQPHRHRRQQLLFGASGVVAVTTPHGTWVMPPQRGIWIPGGVKHDVKMLGAVTMHSLYFEPRGMSGMPDHCQVFGISPFVRSLIAEAVALDTTHKLTRRAAALLALIKHEIRRLPVLPLSLPFPSHDLLAARCRLFVQQPNIHETIDQWANALNMSRRSFTRLFRDQTGVSFVAWRQQACLLSAMPRLAASEPITTIAIDLGYENPAAFTTMFKRAVGSSPLAYLSIRNPLPSR